jgi:sideroflexin-5
MSSQATPQKLIKFHFKETQPNLNSMGARFRHFCDVTDPRYFIISDKEIGEAVENVKKYKALSKDSADGEIEITQEERIMICRGVKIMNSSTNDVGDIVPRMFRMCGFVPVNIPILCGMLIAPPTILNTVLAQWANQSYNAGLNFGNKNSTCKYTNMDIAGGYAAAVSSALIVAVGMRKATTGLVAGATGKKLLLINTGISAVSAGTASFCNTAFMRKAEVDKGIIVYSDLKLENEAGISKLAAYNAVVETASSRTAMSLISVSIPAVLILSCGAVGFRPTGSTSKFLFEVFCIGTALRLGLPASVSIFPPLSIKEGKQLEEQFHKHDKIYFNKGL